MTKEQAIQKAAQLWCDPRVSNRVMDPEFCEVIAEALTASSVKVPSDEEILNAMEDAESHYGKVLLGFTIGARWAIKRMQEND